MKKTFFLAMAVIAMACATTIKTQAGQSETEIALADHGYKKVIYIVLENTDVGDAMKQPFYKELMQRGAFLQRMTGEAHPSQANYIAMIAGDVMGVHGDSNYDINGQHLGDLLESKGRTWKSYAEAYPGNCFTGAKKGTYARKHVPFMSFNNVSKDPKRCAKIVDGNQFDKDLAAGTLPDFSFYTPDMNNDGHDTSPDFSSTFMEKRFGKLIRDPEFMKDVLFVVTFDESESYSNNNIYTVLLGANIKAGSTSTQALNHISILRMIEDDWKLGSLNRKDATAITPAGIWQ